MFRIHQGHDTIQMPAASDAGESFTTRAQLLLDVVVREEGLGHRCRVSQTRRLDDHLFFIQKAIISMQNKLLRR